ncbi:hypothetical protein R4K48_08390 [Brachyspira pulli]|uniref:hypothetical protein n=1 Tax=Brachyspira pulli TaxID=310721 RepID=UPI0030077D70
MSVHIVIDDNVNRYKDIIKKDYPHFDDLYNSIYKKIASGEKGTEVTTDTFLFKERDLYSNTSKQIEVAVLFSRKALKNNNNVLVEISIIAFKFKDLNNGNIIISNN